MVIYGLCVVGGVVIIIIKRGRKGKLKVFLFYIVGLR